MIVQKTLSPRDRTIRLGDTTVELTSHEIRLCAVAYLYRPNGSRDVHTRYASPVEVLMAIYPELLFQVSEDGYESMKAKAERLLALERGERF